MTTEGDFKRAKRHKVLSVGDSVRIARELNLLTQGELAVRASIPQSAISAIENGRAILGTERAKRLARALHVHPAVLLFPDWDTEVVAKRA